MIHLRDVRDYISGLGITSDDNVYSGLLPDKPKEAIGVYNLKRNGTPYIPVGGSSTYEEKGISLLVHWNESPTQTETAAYELFNKLLKPEGTIDNRMIKHIKMLVKEPVQIGPDSNGIQEYVIECIIYLDKE